MIANNAAVRRGDRALYTDRARDLAVITLVLFGVAWLAAGSLVPAYRDAFLLDDYKHLEWIARYMEKPWEIVRVFNPSDLGWNYRPLQRVFFFVERGLFGLTPATYYYSALLLHLANTALVFALSRKLGVRRPGAVAAAVLFALAAIHQDVLGWISSVSAILLGFFALSAAVQMEIYLSGGRRDPRRLAAVAACVALALMAREEAVLVPLVLAAFHLTATGSIRDLTKGEKRFWLLMVGLIVVYAAMLMTRPSWVGQDDGLGVASFVSAADPDQVARYMLDVASRFTFTDPAMAASWSGYLVAGALLLVYGVGLVAGNRAVRLGLIWWGVGCAFIYIVIWRDFGAANRYLYVPWAGLTVALGAALEASLGGASVAPARRWAIRAVTGLALTAFVLLQGSHARDMQALWQGYVDETETARAQLLTAYPRIHPDTHFFAYRLPPVPDYIQSMASVWYGIPLNGFGGSWERLLKYGRATERFYILDVADGQLFNVFPELQAYRETAFIWDAGPTMETIAHDGGALPLDPGAFALDQIVGPPAERRLGLFMHPPAPTEGWASATYPVTIPQGSSLAFGTFKEWGDIDGEDGLTFRVNFLPDAGGNVTLFQESINSPTADWQRHEVDMSDYWGQSGRMQFQVSANGNLIHDHGYWTIPRFVSGPLQ